MRLRAFSIAANLRAFSFAANLRAFSFAAVAAAAVMLAPQVANACAGCRNPNLPMGRSDAGPMPPGSLVLSTTLTGTAVDVSHPAGCEDLLNCDEVPVQPAHSHELFMVPIELRPVLAWGITDTWSMDVQLPFRVVHVSADYQTPDGQHYDPIDANIHHRTETLVGLGDGQLGARAAFRAGEWWITPRVGVTLPFGSTEEDPYAAGDDGIAHQHVQFGTGTFDPVLSLDVSRGFPRMQWAFYGQVQHSLYQSRRGFQGPTRGSVGVSGGWKAPAHPVVLSLGLEGAFEGPERWGGEVYTEELQGRQELMVVPRVAWTKGITTLSMDVRVVVFRRLVEGGDQPGEMTAPVILTLGGSWGLRSGS